MFYLSDFARTLGAKDKQPRKRNSLAENMAITALPSVYASYLYSQALQVAEKNTLQKNLNKHSRNIKEKQEYTISRSDKYEKLKNKEKNYRTSGKVLGNTDSQKLSTLEGYKRQTGNKFLTGRELSGLEKSKKLLPILSKKWERVKEIPVPKNIKDALIPKLKYLTPTRALITVLGGSAVALRTGATLKRIREIKEEK